MAASTKSKASVPTTPFTPGSVRDPRTPEPRKWDGSKDRLPEPLYLPVFKNYQFRYGAYPGFRDCSKKPPWPDGAVAEHARRQEAPVVAKAGRAKTGRTTFKRHERVCGDLQFGKPSAKPAHEFVWFNVRDPNLFDLKPPRRWDPAGLKKHPPRPFYNRADGHFLLNNTCTITNLCLLPELRRLQCYFLPKLPKIRADRNFYLPIKKSNERSDPEKGSNSQTPKSPNKVKLLKPLKPSPGNVGSGSKGSGDSNNSPMGAVRKQPIMDYKNCIPCENPSIGRQNTRWRWTETWKRQLIPWYTNYGPEEPEIAEFKAEERRELNHKHTVAHYRKNQESIERLRAWHRRVKVKTPPPVPKPIDYGLPVGRETSKGIRKVKELFEDPILEFWRDPLVAIEDILRMEAEQRKRQEEEEKRKNPTPPPPSSICDACDYFGDGYDAYMARGSSDKRGAAAVSPDEGVPPEVWDGVTGCAEGCHPLAVATSPPRSRLLPPEKLAESLVCTVGCHPLATATLSLKKKKK